MNTKRPAWVPSRDNPWRDTLEFLGAILALVGFAGGAGGTALALVPSDDGRIKIVVIWIFGFSAAAAISAYRLLRREHVDTRYGRVLEPLHQAHHILRDVAFERYISQEEAEHWKTTIQRSLVQFANAFSVAIGASAHATIKLIKPPEDNDGVEVSAGDYVVKTLVRSSPRVPTPHREGEVITVGQNTDFRMIFDPRSAALDTSCWYCDDLLQLDYYENQHWPRRPTRRNVPYRATMVWPIRKVIRDASEAQPAELYVWGFLTIDVKQPKSLVYDRHFPIGAAYADHLMSALWEPAQARVLLKRIDEGRSG